MKKYLFTLTSVLIWTTMSAQHGGTNMKKFENQLPQQGRGSVRVEYLGKSIDRMVYEFMEEEAIPGLTLAIVQAPYIPRVAGYGVTDLEEKHLAAVNTIWPAGPISQGFAAVAIMQLYEKGKLELQDKISKYLSTLPDSWKDITVFQLLQHSSGIPDYRKNEGFDISVSYSPEELIKSAGESPLGFAPGTDVEQSATNFLLLAQIVEKTGKMSYRDFIQKYQIDYLGLKHTRFGEDISTIKQENTAATGHRHEVFKKDRDYINPSETPSGYVLWEEELIPAKKTGPKGLKGFSDIWASAQDISHWDIALAGGVLIERPENRDLLYKPAALADGREVPAMAGWQFYHHKGLMDIKGSMPGFSVFLSRFTDASELVCVTLMANREGVDLTNLGRRIAAAFDDKLGSGANDNEVYTYESQFGTEQTADNIEAVLREMNIPVFARFDHGRNALEAELEMKPARVIVFGSPKVGTRLMQENPAISLELPLKIAVWEDASGSVWITFPRMRQMASRYGMEDNPVIGNMQKLLENIVRKAANVYPQ